jgi:type I pantothenate kinase
MAIEQPPPLATEDRPNTTPLRGLDFSLDRDRSRRAYSPYLRFFRHEWRRLRADTPMTLAEEDLRRLQGQNESVSMQEVEDIYLPLSRLLNLYVQASRDLYQVTSKFLDKAEKRVPYIIGVAGSVAVGKSTSARILQALLSRWPNHPKVDLITTDGYLFSNAELNARGLMMRKGFPESYDQRGLIRFLADVKAGRPNLRIPVYSHHNYDIVPGAYEVVDQPDVIIVEGLNVLQSSEQISGKDPQVFVSDFFDFTIYVHADVDQIRQWYIDRFMAFRHKAGEDPTSFFRRFAEMSADEAQHHAQRVWTEINEINLFQNILPTRERARLVLDKGQDHAVQTVYLRKL